MKFLAPFVGEWAVEVTFPGQPPAGEGARTTFEFMPGERFLIQRWEVPIPAAPDGIAVIGVADGDDRLLQHYFDTRGVARVYEMSFLDGVWKLWRETPDFSPPKFSQRFEGTFGKDLPADRGGVGDLPRRLDLGARLRDDLPKAVAQPIV